MADGKTLHRSSTLTINVNLRYLTVEPVNHIASREFLQSLEFHEVTENGAMGQYLYIFKVKYDEPSSNRSQKIYSGEWFIRKRVHDFQELEKALRNDFLFRFKSKEVVKESIDMTPRNQMENITHFIQTVINHPDNIANPPEPLLRFLEISYVQYGTSQKFKECFLSKKAGGRYGESKCARCGTLWGKWDSRFFITTSEGIMYSKGPLRHNCEIREVLYFDYNFTVRHGKEQTGHERGIILKCTARRLQLIAPDLFVYFDFLARLQQAMLSSPYLKLHRFDSFAPIRHGHCKWYNSGQDYFADMHQALLSAQNQVYIADWWLSPEFYLQRPVGTESTSLKNRESRLDLVLKNIADRGVQVLIIVYNEPTLALNNDSLHTKTHLESLSTNIKVHRHPNQPFFWSHHEKMVVIDQQIGFMGGLDLCFGRMDNPEHSIFDHAYELTKESQEVLEFWPGIDYSNSRVKDFTNVKQHWQCTLPDKRAYQRMPWQDIAIQVVGEPVVDMARHFMQYWNFVTIEKNFKKRTQGQLLQPNAIVEVHHDTQIHKTVKQLKQKYNQVEDHYQKLPSSQSKRNTGRSEQSKSGFVNNKNHFAQYVKQLEEEIKHDVEQPFFSQEQMLPHVEESKCSIQTLQRIGNHSSLDEESLVSKQPPHLQRVSQAIQRPEPVPNQLRLSYLQMMKNMQNSLDDDVPFERMQSIKHEDQEKYIGPKEHKNIFDSMNIFMTSKVTPKKGSAECQMLRSASNWSVGCKSINVERSIYVAYIQLITEAKQFIYIENQFFISITAGSKVKNEIARALVSRIKYAAANNEEFKVVVFVPLLPGFEGEIDQSAPVLKVQLHWEYATISRGGSSILEQLSADPNIPDPSKYIEFFSLRQHGKSPKTNQPVTEIVYIHSKLMIVDDEVVIMGSANINDRSMLGSRDSEIAMVIHDHHKIESRLGGMTVQVSKFAQTLRTSLYRAHTGLSLEQVLDPLDPELQETMSKQAYANTLFYRKVFACYPDDNILTVGDYERFKKQAQEELYDELLDEVHGQIVTFPLRFLERDDLRFGMLQKEYLLPDYNFT